MLKTYKQIENFKKHAKTFVGMLMCCKCGSSCVDIFSNDIEGEIKCCDCGNGTTLNTKSITIIRGENPEKILDADFTY